MTHLQLLDKILLLDCNRIMGMSSKVIYSLTDHFSEDLVRNFIYRGQNNNEQSRIFNKICNTHFNYELSPRPKYFDDLQMDIECGILLRPQEESLATPEQDNSDADKTRIKQLEEELAKKKAEVKALKKTIKEQKQEIESLSEVPDDINPQQKVRMELARRIMAQAGIDETCLSKRGSKTRAATLMGSMLDIKAHTCQTWLSSPEVDWDHEAHREIIREINEILEFLELDIRL